MPDDLADARCEPLLVEPVLDEGDGRRAGEVATAQQAFAGGGGQKRGQRSAPDGDDLREVLAADVRDHLFNRGRGVLEGDEGREGRQALGAVELFAEEFAHQRKAVPLRGVSPHEFERAAEIARVEAPRNGADEAAAQRAQGPVEDAVIGVEALEERRHVAGAGGRSDVDQDEGGLVGDVGARGRFDLARRGDVASGGGLAVVRHWNGRGRGNLWRHVALGRVPGGQRGGRGRGRLICGVERLVAVGHGGHLAGRVRGDFRGKTAKGAAP